MEELYALSCFIVPNIIWQWINRGKLKGKKYIFPHMLWTYIFMFYCYLAVQDAAGIGTLWDLLQYGTAGGEINLIPFSSDGLTTYILNVIMFMPLGFLLPLIWPHFREWKKVAVTGAAFSLCIEACQLFCLRTTDVDDLLMNTAGTLAGYFAWRIFCVLLEKARLPQACAAGSSQGGSGERAISICGAEPIVYMFLGVAGIFFLYNWRILY